MNLDTLDQILSNVLIIIGYQNDKSNFISEFNQLCLQKTIQTLLASASEEKQQRISNSLNDLKGKNPQNQIEFITSILGVNTNDIKDLSEKKNKDLFDEYIKTIIPTLTLIQKDKLDSFLQTL